MTWYSLGRTSNSKFVSKQYSSNNPQETCVSPGIHFQLPCTSLLTDGHNRASRTSHVADIKLWSKGHTSTREQVDIDRKLQWGQGLLVFSHLSSPLMVRPSLNIKQQKRCPFFFTGTKCIFRWDCSLTVVTSCVFCWRGTCDEKLRVNAKKKANK